MLATSTDVRTAQILKHKLDRGIHTYVLEGGRHITFPGYRKGFRKDGIKIEKIPARRS